MKKIILISMLFVLMLPLTLNAAINYLNDDGINN